MEMCVIIEIYLDKMILLILLHSQNFEIKKNQSPNFTLKLHGV